jgi:drug/metabolite transporter (DMT)-like permease
LPASPAGSHRAVGIALAFVGAALFSLKGVTTKFIYAYGVDATTILALRMLFSVPFFIAVAAWQRGGANAAPLAHGDLARIAVLGLLAYYVASYLDFLGLTYISATLERLTLYLYPTIVLVLSAVFLKAPVRGREVFAIALSYAGIAMVVIVGGRAGGTDVPLGAALVFGSAFTYSIYLVFSTQVIRRVGSLRFTAYGMTIASAVCVAQFLLMRPLDALVLPWSAYLWFVVLAIGHTVLPVFMTAEALKRIGATQVAIIGAVGPITTMAVDWIALGERLAPLQIAGALLVLAGVLLVTLKPGGR